MEFVSRSLFKCCAILLLNILVLTGLQSQEDTITISLRDYHSANITAVVGSSIHPYYFTGDESGKILAHSSESKRVVATVKKSSGIPIKSLRLTNDDLVITANQKYDFSDGSLDSVFYISIFDQRVLRQNKANIEFIGNQNDAILIQDTNQEKSLNIINVYDTNYEDLAKFYATESVTMGAFDLETGQCVLVQNDFMGQINMQLYTKETYFTEPDLVDIPKGKKVVNLFYDNAQLFAIVYNEKSKSVEFYNLSAKPDFNKSIYELENYPSPFISANIAKVNDKTEIVISSTGLPGIKPIIVGLKGGKFKLVNGKYDFSSDRSVYLQDRNEYVFFESYHKNLASSTSFTILDNKDKTFDTKISKKYYSAKFLPDDNWMVIGQDLESGYLGLADWNYEIKYYETGTFNNRFAKWSYNDYLELNHGIKDVSSSGYGFDKRTGLHVFKGYKEDSKQYGFYKYDLIKDKIDLISSIDLGMSVVVDYSEDSNYLLLGQNRYSAKWRNDAMSFSGISEGQEISFEGKYKYGKLSDNGLVLLLIDADNQLTLRRTDNNEIIHSESMKNGMYNIHSVDDMNFIISIASFAIDFETCNTLTKAYDIGSDYNVLTESKDCVNVIDLASNGQIVAMVIENIGLSIGDNIISYSFDEFPTDVSLNQDGSRVMVSFSNGKIRVIDAASLEVIAEMIHPDKGSHIFTNNDNKYFSNVAADDFLKSVKNGKSVALKELENYHYEPKAILEVFGNPNQEYLAALDKAIELKSKVTAEGEEVNNAKSIVSGTQTGDLYVLSIGVSDYLESDYDLTFADKDAYDIANIYGQPTKAEISDYNNRFHSHRFRLSTGGDWSPMLKRYYGLYNNLETLYPLTYDGCYWLGEEDDKYFIWDYKKERIDKFVKPAGFNIDAYESDGVAIPSPDRDGFYYTTDKGALYQYDFSANASSKTTFKTDEEEPDFENLALLRDHRWAYFKFEDEWGKPKKITITSNHVESNDLEQISFEPTVVLVEGQDRNETDTVPIIWPVLKALSSNGIHLLFSDHYNKLYHKNLRNDSELPYLIDNVLISRFDDISINNEGTKIVVVGERSSDFNYTIKSYNLEGDLTGTEVSDDGVRGLMNRDGQVSWVSVIEPLADEAFLESENLLQVKQPYSFDNTYVKSLTNNKATKSTITENLTTFFKNAKPNDQVIVFLAGHGVLDEKLKYYFAPHDMMFNDVTKNGVSFTAIIDALKEIQTKNILLLMDSCHSGSTVDMETGAMANVESSNTADQRGSKSRKSKESKKFKVSTIVNDLMDNFISQSGVTIISASSGEDVAYENQDLGNGAFTSAFIGALKSKIRRDEFVLTEENVKTSIVLSSKDISEIMKEVNIITNGKQTPDLREFNPDAVIKIW